MKPFKLKGTFLEQPQKGEIIFDPMERIFKYPNGKILENIGQLSSFPSLIDNYKVIKYDYKEDTSLYRGLISIYGEKIIDGLNSCSPLSELKNNLIICEKQGKILIFNKEGELIANNINFTSHDNLTSYESRITQSGFLNYKNNDEMVWINSKGDTYPNMIISGKFIEIIEKDPRNNHDEYRAELNFPVLVNMLKISKISYLLEPFKQNTLMNIFGLENLTQEVTRKELIKQLELNGFSKKEIIEYHALFLELRHKNKNYQDLPQYNKALSQKEIMIELNTYELI